MCNCPSNDDNCRFVWVFQYLFLNQAQFPWMTLNFVTSLVKRENDFKSEWLIHSNHLYECFWSSHLQIVWCTVSSICSHANCSGSDVKIFNVSGSNGWYVTVRIQLDTSCQYCYSVKTDHHTPSFLICDLNLPPNWASIYESFVWRKICKVKRI